MSRIEGKECMIVAAMEAIGITGSEMGQNGRDGVVNLRLNQMERASFPLDPNEEAENLQAILRFLGDAGAEIRFIMIHSTEELCSVFHTGMPLFLGFPQGQDTPAHIVYLKGMSSKGYDSNDDIVYPEWYIQERIDQHGYLYVYYRTDPSL